MSYSEDYFLSKTQRLGKKTIFGEKLTTEFVFLSTLYKHAQGNYEIQQKNIRGMLFYHQNGLHHIACKWIGHNRATGRRAVT